MMKNNMKKIFFIFLVTGLFSCGNKNNQDSQANIPDNTVHEQTEGTPSRKPFEGFEWVKTTGSGISLMTQKNDHIRLIADPALPGIVMVRDETPVPQRKRIKSSGRPQVYHDTQWRICQTNKRTYGKRAGTIHLQRLGSRQ